MSADPLLLRSALILRRPHNVLPPPWLACFFIPCQVWLLHMGHPRSASQLDTIVSLEGSHRELVFMFALLTSRMERHHR